MPKLFSFLSKYFYFWINYLPPWWVKSAVDGPSTLLFVPTFRSSIRAAYPMVDSFLIILFLNILFFLIILFFSGPTPPTCCRPWRRRLGHAVQEGAPSLHLSVCGVPVQIFGSLWQQQSQRPVHYLLSRRATIHPPQRYQTVHGLLRFRWSGLRRYRWTPSYPLPICYLGSYQARLLLLHAPPHGTMVQQPGQSYTLCSCQRCHQGGQKVRSPQRR